MTSRYLFEPKNVVALIKDIDQSHDLSKFKGHAQMPADVDEKGPSGAKFRCLVTELNSRIAEDTHYLEIGILRGKTIFTSALDNPRIRHIGIDNFSQFDPDGMNAATVYKTIEDMGIRNVEVIEADFKQYFIDMGRQPERNTGVFFYDAIHDYRSQLIGLLQASRIMRPGGIILVDDTNYAHVRYSTYDFIESHPDFKLLFETFTYMHPGKMSPEVKAAAKQAWYNGTQVLIYDPENRAKGLGATRSEDTDARFARAVTQTPADCPGLPTLIAEQD